MAKQGMKRPDWTPEKQDRVIEPVPEIQGPAKHGKEPAGPMTSLDEGAGACVADLEHPISEAYSAIDTDLARDNLENDIPAADLTDL